MFGQRENWLNKLIDEKTDKAKTTHKNINKIKFNPDKYPKDYRLNSVQSK